MYQISNEDYDKLVKVIDKMINMWADVAHGGEIWDEPIEDLDIWTDVLQGIEFEPVDDPAPRTVDDIVSDLWGIYIDDKVQAAYEEDFAGLLDELEEQLERYKKLD